MTIRLTPSATNTTTRPYHHSDEHAPLTQIHPQDMDSEPSRFSDAFAYTPLIRHLLSLPNFKLPAPDPNPSWIPIRLSKSAQIPSQAQLRRTLELAAI
jgi:hypothetical protein